ncbi:helix-turn-helix domain-containing protein [Ningiella sp. W23]|uniref:helix-turn-helix domain-containing protein n=1 Tax=Ningiella sp. W23 TaxID=3023715 RepID=UPI003756E49A
MIIKKLREKRNWSQEQLATMCGLSTRTIQRIESGNNASLESLKSLASVFEVDISTLTKEITVIDKESAQWKAQPLWFRYQFFGIKKKRHAQIGEYALILLGLYLALLSVNPHIAWIAFVGAYISAKLNHRMDINSLW